MRGPASAALFVRVAATAAKLGLGLLNVVDGQVVSGAGTLNIYGLSNASLALITYETPGIIPQADDLLGYTCAGISSAAFPIDGNGLLFDVGIASRRPEGLRAFVAKLVE